LLSPRLGRGPGGGKLTTSMKPIPKERKDSIIAKLIGPDATPVTQLAHEEHISSSTLYNWKREAKIKAGSLANPDDAPKGWTATDKFEAVIQTASMSEVQVSEFCRSKGLYPEQIQRWKTACQQANNWDDALRLNQKDKLKKDKQKIKTLERELLRKEKALAEAAALLVLQKKVRAIWEDEDA